MSEDEVRSCRRAIFFSFFCSVKVVLLYSFLCQKYQSSKVSGKKPVYIGPRSCASDGLGSVCMPMMMTSGMNPQCSAGFAYVHAVSRYASISFFEGQNDAINPRNYNPTMSTRARTKKNPCR